MSYCCYSSISSSSLRLFKIPKLPSFPTSSSSSLFFFFSPPPLSFSFPLIKSPPFALPTSTTQPSLHPIDHLPPKLQHIVTLFQSVPDPKSKYQQLLFYGKNLKPLDAHFKTKENKVEGCVSQVWVRAYLDSHQNVFFEADSDSVLTKGLAALLVQGLSGCSVEEILGVSSDFVVLLGLQQSLTPSRNNGFLNMLKLMQKKAVEVTQMGLDGEDPGKAVASLNLVDKVGNFEVEEVASTNLGDQVGNFEVQEVDSDDNGSVGVEEVKGVGLGRRGMRIKEVLERELRPLVLEVEDVSYQHSGHAGVRGSGGDGETHFNVNVVSSEFEGKSPVKRHRLVYGLLQEEFQNGLHALSIDAKTPSEAEAT